MELRIDLTADQRIRAVIKIHVHRRETIEGNSQYAEDRLYVLLHAAAFRADGDAFAFEIGNGLDRVICKPNKTHRAGIGWRHHADGNLFAERRRRVFSPSDP